MKTIRHLKFFSVIFLFFSLLGTSLNSKEPNLSKIIEKKLTEKEISTIYYKMFISIQRSSTIGFPCEVKFTKIIYEKTLNCLSNYTHKTKSNKNKQLATDLSTLFEHAIPISCANRKKDHFSKYEKINFFLDEIEIYEKNSAYKLKIALNKIIDFIKAILLEYCTTEGKAWQSKQKKPDSPRTRPKNPREYLKKLSSLKTQEDF